jgi:hypothetical protein
VWREEEVPVLSMLNDEMRLRHVEPLLRYIGTMVPMVAGHRTGTVESNQQNPTDLFCDKKRRCGVAASAPLAFPLCQIQIHLFDTVL